MSRIFMTGGTGFLGSHLADALVAAGHRVVCSIRASSDLRWIGSLDLETVQLDLGEGDSTGTSASPALVEALKATDVVIHGGALTRARNEREFMQVNAGGTERLVRAASAAGVNRFILISSLAARGPDGADGPISPYGRSKAAAEELLARYRGDMSAIVIRPGGVYGPRDADLLPLFRLVSKGWTIVPNSPTPLQPIYVSDVVAAMVAALDAGEVTAPIALAGKHVHGWDDLAAGLVAAVGKPGRTLRISPGLFWVAGLASEVGALVTRQAAAMDRRRARDMSVHSWTCELEPAKQALAGWDPKIGIEEGLSQTAAWYREIGWL